MKRPRKRPHVRDPEGGHCPGCDDELGVHRADAYCRACGGTCRDPATIAALGDRPVLSLRPSFTGAGQTSFKPARHANRGPGK